MRMQLGGLKEHRLAIYRARTGAPTDRTTRNHMLVGLGVWVAAFAVLAVLLGGCATMAAYQEEQRQYQALADQATHALGGGDVSILMVAGTAGNAGSASCAQGTITVGRDSDDVKWLLAHEIGHHVTHHCGMGLVHEIAANSGAIKVLQVWGETEEQAVRRTGNRLLRLKQRGWTLPGHDYCAEFSALRKEYPQYQAKDPAKIEATCPGSNP